MITSKTSTKTTKPKGALLTKCVYANIFQQVTAELKALPCADILTNDLHTLTFVADKVEELLSQTPNKGIDKPELIVEILVQFFNLTATEKTELQGTLGYLYDNQNISVKTTCGLIGDRLLSFISTQTKN
jgi:hypothetical protein